MPEGRDRVLRIAGILRQKTDTVPGIRILRILLQSIFQSRFGFVDFLQIQIGNAFVQPRNGKFRISLGCLLKLFKGLLKELLVHIRNPEIVKAGGFDRIGLGGGREKSCCRSQCGKEHGGNFWIHFVNDLTTGGTGNTGVIGIYRWSYFYFAYTCGTE